MKKIKKNYINNKDLLQALIDYKGVCFEAEEGGEIKPIVPDYIAVSILTIAKRLSTKPNFYNYPFREDMIMDGVENCLLYMHNFDENKYNNPFAYFTTIIWQAFIRRITKEKKQLYIRYKNSQSAIASGGTYVGDSNIHLTSDVDYINSFIEDFEEKMAKDKEKKNAPRNN
jgi:hypothetical protein